MPRSQLMETIERQRILIDALAKYIKDEMGRDVLADIELAVRLRQAEGENK